MVHKVIVRKKMFYFLRGNTMVIAAFTDMRMRPDNILRVSRDR